MLTAICLKGEEVLASITWDGETSFSVAADEDADHVVPGLEGSVFYVQRRGDDYGIFREINGAIVCEETLAIGDVAIVGDFRWLLVRPEADTNESSVTALRDKITEWLRRPMRGHASFREALEECLKVLIENTPANKGMLVLSEGDSFTLLQCYGLGDAEAEELWARIPESIREMVLRDEARTILPETFAEHKTNDTTVFIQGVKTIAGFPVHAEGSLFAIFFLGFENIFMSLSAELQSELEDVAMLVGLVLQRAKLREELSQAQLINRDIRHSLPGNRLMVGGSNELGEVYRLIQRLAPVDVPTLILGETGTGKELAAKEIHRFSNRSGKPFVVVNAAAIPENLIESELFGHKKGAFTGALSDKAGLIERADGGTLFVDELGELAIGLQAKLLRVLQERAVQRLGEGASRNVDFRLVAATHRDLEMMVREGTFREDLYYRIAGATIQVPALRFRTTDILPLANYFKKRFIEKHNLVNKEWTAEAVTFLVSHSWPGNIRELENTVARACVMADGELIHRHDLEARSATDESDIRLGFSDERLSEAKEAWMKSFIAAALARHQGKRSETARALGIGERTLFRYIEQLKIRDDGTT